MDETIKKYGFLVQNNCSMMCLTSAIEPLRVANRLSDQHLYEWPLLTADGNPATASNGFEITPNMDLRDATALDILFICGGIGMAKVQDRHLLSELRRIVQRGTGIGGLSTGTFVLAAAGLLNGFACTIHWEGAISLQESYPNVNFTANLFEIDRNRYTCAGATSSLDLMLYMIGQDHGDRLVQEISLQFVHDRVRNQNDKQRVVHKLQLAVKSQKLLKIVDIMEQNIEDPLSLDTLAQAAGISIRQVERLFRQHIDMSPGRYYMELRLEHARLLLVQTSMSITEIFIASGFPTHSFFAKKYREFFGISPSRERKPK